MIGRARGVVDVGIYSRAGGLVEIFNRLVMRPVTQICLPYFANSDRGTGSLVPAYVNSAALLTGVGWPFLGFLAVMSYPVIRIIYGTQWLDAVPLARLLCLAGAIELTFILTRDALLARGLARRANTMQMQILSLQLLGLGAVFPFGLIGACWGLVAAALGGAVLAQWHLRQSIGLGLVDLARACGPSFLLLLGAVGPVALMAAWAPPDESNYIRWAVIGTLWVLVAWLAGLRLLRHRLWEQLRQLHSRAWRFVATAE